MTGSLLHLKHDYSTDRRVHQPFVPDSTCTLQGVGCYTGSFGAGLKSLRSIEIWRVEPDRDVTVVASQRLDRVIDGRFGPDCSLPRASFDVIIFNNSLQHFAEPVPARKFRKCLLPPNGRIVCTKPNVRHINNLEPPILEADWRYEDAGICDRRNLRFFSKKSMKRPFETCGYQVIEQGGINAEWWARNKVLRRVLFRLFP